MGISSLGLASGIDSASIIDQLVAIEQQKVTKVENEIQNDEAKISAYSQVKSLLTTLQSKVSSLSESSAFDCFTSESSDDTCVKIEGNSGAVDGSYNVKVFQLAANEKMISRNYRITSQTASLSSMGISTGTISVDGVEIEIDNDDTIQDLRSKINSSTNSSGEKIGVSASVVKVSETNFRLVLSAKETGSEGIQYQDVNGSVLQDLGIISNSSGDKGNTTQSIETNDNFETGFNASSSGTSIRVAGTDHNGNAVDINYTKASNSTINDFLSRIEESFNGTVDASIDSSSGALILQDTITGRSDLSISHLSTGTTEQSVTLRSIGNEGNGVLSSGKDAYFSVENIAMKGSSNTVDNVVTGVTFTLDGVSTEGETVSIKRDNDAIKEKVQAVVDAYNALLSYSKSATAYADPDDEDSSNGVLAGDSIVSSMVSQIRANLKQDFSLFGTSDKYTSLIMFGLKTDTSTGQMKLDEDMFDKGVTTHYNDLLGIFNKIGVPDSTAVTFGRSTADTSAGKYDIEEVDSEHLRIRLSGSNEWYTSETRSGDIVTFSDGPAKGLSLTVASGSLNGAASTFTFSKGLGLLLDEAIAKFNDSSTGTIAMRKNSIQSGIDRKETRVEKLTDQIERYRDRLTKQYAALEEALSTLNSQTSSIISSFGS
jgi:flagellar hook-associated protein 2